MQEHGQALLGVLVGAVLALTAAMMLTAGSCKVSYSHFNTFDNKYGSVGPPPSVADVEEALEFVGLEVKKADESVVESKWATFYRTLSKFKQLEIRVRLIVDLQPKRRIQAQCMSREVGGDFEFVRCQDRHVMDFMDNAVRTLESVPGFGG
jgi:hypothetical protein